jgi:hypothetical protein
MLETIASAKLPSPVRFAEWSPAMDVIALVYTENPDCIELRRMDWTRVNSIPLGSPAAAICFSPTGHAICAATTEHRVLLFGIEKADILCATIFGSAISAVHMAGANGVSLTIIAFSDGKVSIFSDFYLALAEFDIGTAAINILASSTNIFLLQEDGLTLSRFGLPFLNDGADLIKAISNPLLTYWTSRQTIETARSKLTNLFKRIADETAPFSSAENELVQSFLCGRDPPEISSDVHRARLRKSIAHDIREAKSVLTREIIPSFLELDKSAEKLRAAVDISSLIGLADETGRSSRQLRNALSMVENLNKLDRCFESLFDYLQPEKEKPFEVPTAEFCEFLASHLSGFDFLEIEVGTPPTTFPVLPVERQEDLQLPCRHSSMAFGRCACVGRNCCVVDLATGEVNQYEVEGRPITGFAFADETVGCFFEKEDHLCFVLFNGDDETPHEVSLLNAGAVVISSRKIALVESTELFCSVVDLLACTDEGAEQQEDGEDGDEM